MYYCKDCKYCMPNASHIETKHKYMWSRCRFTIKPKDNSVYMSILPMDRYEIDEEDADMGDCWHERRYGSCKGYAWNFEAKDGKHPRTFKEKLKDTLNYYGDCICAFLKIR